jgi:hypothetical protein
LTDPTPGEVLVAHFGIISPQDLDIDAIARVLGATVRYEPLLGCEARIVGTDTRAIICINSTSHPARQRFSLAHELAHWHFDRYRGLLICATTDIEKGDDPKRRLVERQADRVASHLLMPRFLVEPVIGRPSTLTFETVRIVGATFKTSMTASAIRLVDMNLLPAVLVCHNNSFRSWFVRARDVPEYWFPRSKCSGGADAGRMRVPAANWFDCPEADDAELVQESLTGGAQGEVLTLLTGFTSRMLRERDTATRTQTWDSERWR